MNLGTPSLTLCILPPIAQINCLVQEGVRDCSLSAMSAHKSALHICVNLDSSHPAKEANSLWPNEKTRG